MLGSAAARTLGLRVRFLMGAWIFISCECCVLSVRGVCDGPNTIPEDSYLVWYIWSVSSKIQQGGDLGAFGLSKLIKITRKYCYSIASRNVPLTCHTTQCQIHTKDNSIDLHVKVI